MIAKCAIQISQNSPNNHVKQTPYRIAPLEGLSVIPFYSSGETDSQSKYEAAQRYALKVNLLSISIYSRKKGKERITINFHPKHIDDDGEGGRRKHKYKAVTFNIGETLACGRVSLLSTILPCFDICDSARSLNVATTTLRAAFCLWSWR
ncbi:hypothetical protein Q1695_003049 [Nippostrongylus brasiliensis]|nr:hypothetical protein Q1695_003049 [Nippostrongylus brasiliensis]